MQTRGRLVLSTLHSRESAVYSDKQRVAPRPARPQGIASAPACHDLEGSKTLANTNTLSLIFANCWLLQKEISAPGTIFVRRVAIAFSSRGPDISERMRRAIPECCNHRRAALHHLPKPTAMFAIWTLLKPEALDASRVLYACPKQCTQPRSTCTADRFNDTGILCKLLRAR